MNLENLHKGSDHLEEPVTQAATGFLDCGTENPLNCGA